MKTLLLSWGRHGGGPRYALELARALSRMPDLELHLSVSRQAELYGDFLSVPACGRCDVDTYSSLAQFAYRTARLHGICAGLGRYVKRRGIEVVLCTMDHMWSSFAAGSVKRAGASYVLVLHDAVRHPGEDSALRAWLLRRDIRRADAIITLSAAVRDRLLEMYGYPPERVRCIPHGVFSYGRAGAGRSLPGEGPVRLLFFGRILEYKGLDILLEAMPMIRRRIGDVRLHICGTGDLSPFAGAMERVGGLEITNRWIREDEMASIFSGADIVVLPYREASQSGVIAAAAGFGVPAVVTPVGGLVEQVGMGPCGLVARDVSAEAVAEAVCELATSPELYARLSRRCVELADGELGWEAVARRIVEALEDAVSTPGRPGRPGLP